MLFIPYYRQQLTRPDKQLKPGIENMPGLVHSLKKVSLFSREWPGHDPAFHDFYVGIAMPCQHSGGFITTQ